MLNNLIKILPASFIDRYESWILKKDKRIISFINNLNQSTIHEIVEKKLLNIFENAAKNVPAYKDFLGSRKVEINLVNSLEKFNSIVLATTKQNYVNKYTIEQRCMYGKLSKHGNIDEGSGSTGIPVNWIRSVDEEKILHKLFRFEFDYDLDGNRKNYIILNTWSSGPWATGVKFCEIMQDYALIKNIGSDINDTLRSLKSLGKKYNYIIAGYPPFLKRLIDKGKKEINWRNYKIDIITGGEGFIPEWRDYIRDKLGRNCRIFSAYGSSDIDIGIAFETPFTIFIRDLVRKNVKLRERLFGSKNKIPMVFHYNPMQHYIRNITSKRKDGTKVSEFEITALERSAISPKIKYNIHDEGCVFSFEKMINILNEYEKNFIEEFYESESQSKNVLRLPFLWINGRTDGTVSIDGANVYPSQIEMCIHSDKGLLDKTNSFKISIDKGEKGSFRFVVLIELKENYKGNKKLQKKYQDVILKNLLKLNDDYKASYFGNKKFANPKIVIYANNTGPFRLVSEPIKNKYIVDENGA